MIGFGVEELEFGAKKLENELPGTGHVFIEVNCSKERLQGVREIGGAQAPAASFLAIAEEQGLAEFDAAGGFGEGRFGDNAGAELGEEAFLQIREVVKKVVGDREFKDGIAQEFETLVVQGRWADLRGQAGVGKRLGEKFLVVELVS